MEDWQYLKNVWRVHGSRQGWRRERKGTRVEKIHQEGVQEPRARSKDGWEGMPSWKWEEGSRRIILKGKCLATWESMKLRLPLKHRQVRGASHENVSQMRQISDVSLIIPPFSNNNNGNSLDNLTSFLLAVEIKSKHFSFLHSNVCH